MVIVARGLIHRSILPFENTVFLFRFFLHYLSYGISSSSCDCHLDGMGEHKGKKLLPSVSTSLALAASIGIAEAVALFFGSGFLMNIMGIPVVRRRD